LNSSPDKIYRRFLLGIASEEEECRVEEAVLAGELDALFLQTAEDELIDDYLLGRITQQERQGFDEQFLITEERRQKLRFAFALIEYSQKAPAQENPVKRKIAPRGSNRVLFSWKYGAFLAATASVLLAVLAGVEQMQLQRQVQIASEVRNELTQLQTASAADNRRAARMGEPSAGTPGGMEDAVDRMPVIEFASATRTVYPTVFRVPADARFARIDWELSPPLAEKYREVLLSGSGQQLWAQEFPATVLSAARRSTIVVPASILAPGIYHLRLDRDSTNGQFEELADSVFRVVRE
jgi:hypothetical protein